MRVEVKALIYAVVAGLAVLGATFGVSALVVGVQASREGHKAASLTRAAQTPGAGAPVVDAALVAQGHAFYTQSCASCHGAGGGGGYGPGLHKEDLSDVKIALKIKNGVSGRMPPFGGKYNAQQTQALVAYIRSLK